MQVHFGHWLKRQIALMPMDQTEFATHAGIPRPSLSKWLASPCPPIRPANIVRLAKGLGKTPEEIEQRLAGAKVTVTEGEQSTTSTTIGRVPLLKSPHDELLAKHIPSIRSGYFYGFVPTQAVDGKHFCRVVGDTQMFPPFEPGDLVIYEQVDPRAADFGQGRVSVFEAGGETHFLLVQSHPTDPSKFVAKPLNPKSRPRKLTIDRNSVSLMGLSQFTFPLEMLRGGFIRGTPPTRGYDLESPSCIPIAVQR